MTPMLVLATGGGPGLSAGAENADPRRGRTRFVPIAMTSLATVIGLIPTAMGLDRGAEANRPLALAVVGALTSSTLLSLFLVPVIFMALAKRSTVEAPAE